MLSKENLALLIEFNENEIIILLREALKDNLKIYTFDHEDKPFLVPKNVLQKIYSNNPQRTEIIFSPGIFTKNQIHSLDIGREIGIADLVLDRLIALKILKIEKPTIKHTTLCADESPKERDQRLLERGGEIFQLNRRKISMKDIQQQILKEEQNKSKVTISILRKVISRKAIKTKLTT